MFVYCYLCDVDVSDGYGQSTAGLGDEKTKDEHRPTPTDQTQETHNVDADCHQSYLLATPAIGQTLQEQSHHHSRVYDGQSERLVESVDGPLVADDGEEDCHGEVHGTFDKT